MVATIRNIAIAIVVSSAVAYAAFVFFGSIVAAQTKQDLTRVVASDELSPSTHNLTGIVMVPSACHRLISRVKQMDIENYLITFRIWQDPNRMCPDEPTPQRFHLTVFAPSTGITFQATLDDEPIDLEVIPTIRK